MSTPLTDAEIAAIKARCDAATVSIPGLPGYEADIAGNIWSVASNWRGYGARRLAPHPDGRDGYLKVKVKANGRMRGALVHQLVCRAFHGEPLVGQEVCHRDGSRTNNAAANLHWGTRAENAAERESHGRTARGERNGYARLRQSDVDVIRGRFGESQRALAREFGVAQTTISRILRGVYWK